MPERPFLSLADADRRFALSATASASGRRMHLLEKDVWVVQTLEALTASPFGEHLTLKGGTSLAKAFGVTRRFSEDLDVTYDIRAIAPDLVANGEEGSLPATRSQERRWTREIRLRLDSWVRDQLLSEVETHFARTSVAARLRSDRDRLYVEYEPLFEDYGFVKPEVTVEFGARSTGEPREVRLIQCDAMEYRPEMSFPTAHPHVMAAERTFWEKATAVHVFCRQQRSRGERLSRHWHDLVRLDDAGFAERALADRTLALAVARHKAMFFREKDAAGEWVDYGAAISGDLQLVPEGSFHEALADDYGRMLSDGMLLDDEERFEDVMERCAELQKRANR